MYLSFDVITGTSCSDTDWTRSRVKERTALSSGINLELEPFELIDVRGRRDRSQAFIILSGVGLLPSVVSRLRLRRNMIKFKGLALSEL